MDKIHDHVAVRVRGIIKKLVDIVTLLEGTKIIDTYHARRNLEIAIADLKERIK